MNFIGNKKQKREKEKIYNQMNKELRQKILDLIWKSMKFGEIAKTLNVSLDDVCIVFEANLNNSCITDLSKEAV